MENQIHVYYGYGKGKTTACTGLTVRALGSGKKVCIIYFDKGYKDIEHYSERKILRSINGCEVIGTGCERIKEDGEFRFGVTKDDKEEAQRALTIAKEKIESKDLDVLVMDEILAAAAYGLIDRQEVLDIIDLYNDNGRPFELILSGHQIWNELSEKVDLITEIRKVKHYYDKGIKAREGIDF